MRCLVSAAACWIALGCAQERVEDDPSWRPIFLEQWNLLLRGYEQHLKPSKAAGRLSAPGLPNRHGTVELATRMCWALGAAAGEDSRAAELLRTALLHGTKPDASDSWLDPSRAGIHQIESATVAYAVWQSRAQVFSELDDEAQARIAHYLTSSARPPPWRGNYALFPMVNHAARRALGMPFQEDVISSAIASVRQCYQGDGWFTDSANANDRFFDDYSFWVFAQHLGCYIEMSEAHDPENSARFREWIGLLARATPYFYDRDGGYANYGRSTSYKFARLAFLVNAYRLGASPLPVGLLRSLVERHLAWHFAHGSIDSTGYLLQTLTGDGTTRVREDYIGIGSQYWAMQLYGALWSLAADDRFWTAPPLPLPSDQGAFFEFLPIPCIGLMGLSDGGVLRINGGANCVTRDLRFTDKYSKLFYHSRLGFDIGAGSLSSPDGTLQFSSNGAHWQGLWIVTECRVDGPRLVRRSTSSGVERETVIEIDESSGVVTIHEDLRGPPGRLRHIRVGSVPYSYSSPEDAPAVTRGASSMILDGSRGYVALNLKPDSATVRAEVLEHVGANTHSRFSSIAVLSTTVTQPGRWQGVWRLRLAQPTNR